MSDTNITELTQEQQTEVFKRLREAIDDLTNACFSDDSDHGLRGVCHVIGYDPGREPHNFIREIEDLARRLSQYRDSLIYECR